jgi:hypothetical protein
MKGTAHQVLIIKGTMIHNYEILIMKGRTIVIHDYPRYDDHQSSILIMELKRYCSPATDNERYNDHPTMGNERYNNHSPTDPS